MSSPTGRDLKRRELDHSFHEAVRLPPPLRPTRVSPQRGREIRPIPQNTGTVASIRTIGRESLSNRDRRHTELRRAPVTVTYVGGSDVRRPNVVPVQVAPVQGGFREPLHNDHRGIQRRTPGPLPDGHPVVVLVDNQIGTPAAVLGYPGHREVMNRGPNWEPTRTRFL